MEPFGQAVLQNIAANLAVNGIEWIRRSLLAKDKLARRQTGELKAMLKSDQQLTSTTKAAAAMVAADFQDAEITQLGRFLSSPEVMCIVRQIYAKEFGTPRDQVARFTDIQEEFTALLCAHVGKPQPAMKPLGEKMLTALIRSCEKVAAEVRETEGLLKYDTRTLRNHQLIEDELKGISMRLEFLDPSNKLDVAEIDRFACNYCQQAEQKHGWIVPQDPYGRREKVPIGDIYVASDVAGEGEDENGQDGDDWYEECDALDIEGDRGPQRLTAAVFPERIFRTVLLGQPGGGKSTFANKLCYDLARAELNGQKHVPLFVGLRKYGRSKRSERCSIRQFIERSIPEDYQMSDIPAHAIEYLLLNGRAFVVFDGLDELLDTSERETIRDAVELFCRQYPDCPVLVTSREIGYERAPLNRKVFSEFHLAPFSVVQVEEYARKWFARNSELANEKREEMISAFMEESAAAEDLRTNPLMLSLLCNVYRQKRHIPRNRPDIYQRCAQLLFDQWDRDREIDVPFEYEYDLERVLAYLAYWMAQHAELQDGVSEKQLIEKVTQYYAGEDAAQTKEAGKVARKLVEFCRGRAWVFTDVGTDAEQGLYTFTHRTFMEYFTAVHLNRVYLTPRQLGKALRQHIGRREWDGVAQLAYHIMFQGVEKNAALLTDLLEIAEGGPVAEDWNRLSFAARCLDFVRPGAPTVQVVVIACLRCCVVTAENRGCLNARRSLLADVLNHAGDNRDAVESALATFLKSEIDSGEKKRAKVGFDLSISLPYLAVGNAAWELARRVSKRILADCRPALTVMAQWDLGMALYCVEKGYVSVGRLLDWHKPLGLFKIVDMCVSGVQLRGLATRLLLPLFAGQSTTADGAQSDYVCGTLEGIGAALIEMDPPWMARPSNTRLSLEDAQQAFTKAGSPAPLTDAASFGAFALFAVYLELGLRVTGAVSRGPCAMELAVLARRARLDKSHMTPFVQRVAAAQVTEEQRGFIERWARGEIDLVKSPVAGA